jgi:hypothetical protein
MRAPATSAHGRGTARFEDSFHDALYRSVRQTPWWFVSLGVHLLLAALLFNIDFSTSATPQPAQVASKLAEIPPELPDEEIPPVLEEMRPVERQDEEIPVEVEEFKSEEPVEETDSLVDDPSDVEDPNPAGPFEGFSTNDRIGIGGGAAGGSNKRLGRRRLVARSSGFTRTEDAVNQGLRWLADHQDPAGFWDCDGFMRMDKVTPVCDGPGNPLYDPGVSGLALLAFLGAGQTHKHGEYKLTVRNGLKYLKQIQDPEGCFGPRTTDHFTYNHAIAALAMAEAYGLTLSPLFKQSAQQGIDFVHKCQNPYLAWRYGVRPGDNDSSVSGWMIMALKSAKTSGLRVDPSAFEGMRHWIEKATEPEYGRVGYTTRGSGPARPTELMDRFPADRSESLTAVGVLSRVFLGEDPARSEMIRKGTELCLKALPEWNPEAGTIDMYYWYYGCLALFQVGGDPWRKWNESIKDAILPNQRTGPPAFRGSWDPVGPWGHEGGRVYSTALMVMCMEVYYRYPQLFGSGR